MSRRSYMTDISDINRCRDDLIRSCSPAFSASWIDPFRNCDCAGAWRA